MGVTRECRHMTLSDYRRDDGADGEIGLATAVDVAIRDLREILSCWGSELARQRAEECKSMLRRAYSGFVIDQIAPR